MMVLFGYQYFFVPKKAVDTNANNANTEQAAATPTPAAVNAPTAQPQQPNAQTPAQAAPDTVAARTLTIRSPLYEVKIDSKGGVASSWVLLRDRSSRSDNEVWADGSSEGDKKPLQLISQKALEQNPRELPFRIIVDDAAMTTALNDRNYQISIPESDVTLAPGETKTFDLTMTGDNGLTVKKTFTFRADSYLADLALDVKQNGQVVPNTRLAIGASIGDQAIPHHNFYHIESEAVAEVGGDIKRHQGGAAFKFENGADRATLTDSGSVNWAGVGDAYFAMAAIPAKPADKVDYTSYKYDVQIEPYFYSIISWIIRSSTTQETRHLVTAYLPVTADGSVTKIYTGTKDYFALKDYNEVLNKEVNRPIDIVHFINFSNYFFLRPITTYLSIPILYALHYINAAVHSYGLAIIIFTIFFYSLLFPLRWSQSRSFKKSSANAPKMKELQDKIKDLQKKGVPNDDPRMRDLQMQQLKMTKDALPIGGCLPMLLQFPLLIAFYTAITISLGARQATFMWLPDLSASDPFHILEFAFAISMVLSMKFTPQAAVATPEQQMQQKLMTFMMPALMLYALWGAPSGLLLYWFTGNIVSFIQQMIINRMNKPATAGMEIVADVPANAKKVK